MSRTTLLLLFALAAAPVAGAAEGGVTIGILIDDLGNSRQEGERVARLPAAVAAAVLPHTPYARTVANAVHAAGKEVLLHLPMEPREMLEPGPGQIDSHMPPLEMRATLDYALSTVPHTIGINNHMGSLLTTQSVAMDWLMRELRARNLFFIDSRTHADSVALATARTHDVPALERQVFLDSDPAPPAVAAQLARLEQLARHSGYALAIGHPHATTLAALEQWLPTLPQRGIRVIPLTTRLAQIAPGVLPPATLVHPWTSEEKPWHASWSR